MGGDLKSDIVTLEGIGAVGGRGLQGGGGGCGEGMGHCGGGGFIVTLERVVGGLHRNCSFIRKGGDLRE